MADLATMVQAVALEDLARGTGASVVKTSDGILQVRATDIRAGTRTGRTVAQIMTVAVS